MNQITRIKPEVSRRSFLKGSAGLTFAVAFGGGSTGLLTAAQAQNHAGMAKIGAWVSIGADDVITIITPGAEMGQGSMTGVPLILADEMDADWEKVKLEWAPADAETYGYSHRDSKSMAIVGSRAIQKYFPDMRIAGAQVRKVLVNAAAEKWGVPASELRTEPSAVVHGPSGRRMSYGQIAAFAKVPAAMPKVAAADLKKPSEFRYIGKGNQRRDIPEKVDGTALFAIDVQLPGMVYATTVHSPVQGAAPQSWNADAIKAMKGIHDTVKLDKGVAIVGDTFEHVMAARANLQVQWGKTKAAGYDSEKALNEAYAKVAEDAKAKKASVESKGDANAAFAGAAKTTKADFWSDYGYHAQMEPLNATARMSADRKSVEVWDGSQSPDRSRQGVAKALGFKEEQVSVHQCYMGGGFGRRSLGDYAAEAALIARAVSKPVKLIWTREEDIAYGMFRPQNFQCVEAAQDASGKVVGWKHCIVGDGKNLLTGGMKIHSYYDLPNRQLELRGTSHGIRLKHWRAVAHVFNIFAIEETVDRMAVAANMDPLEFRLKNMSVTPKMRGCLEKVAEMCDWKASRSEGRALGLSISERSGSLGAAVVEISVDKASGKIDVHKVWLAADGGTIVQPDGARANLESGIMHGLSSVLHERVTVKDGAVEQSNFHDYQVMRMSDTPELIAVEFIEPTKGKPTGLGELGNPPIPSAIAAAFHRLTGKRLTHMPFTPERVLAALKA